MIRYLPPLPRRPQGLVVRVLGQMRRELGVRPEALTLHHPIPELLAVTWACLREAVIAPGRLPRPIKEAMALAVSHANRCPYCVDAHGMMLQALGRGADQRRLAHGQAPGDGRMAAFTAWAASTSGAQTAETPFSRYERAEAVATACCFQYINRLATVLLGNSPLPWPARRLRGPAVALVGRTLTPATTRISERGDALALVPDEIPRDAGHWDHLGWSADDPILAAAFSAFAEVTERAGESALEPATRQAIRQALERWNGEAPPLGREVFEGSGFEPLAGLDDAQRAAGRLAVLTALAPHRVTESEVGAFRRHLPGDRELLGLLCWAAHEAAKAISGRMAPAATSGAALSTASRPDAAPRHGAR